MPEPDRLEKIFTTAWDYLMTDRPEYATVVGYPGQNGRWSDVSLASFDRRRGEAEAFAELARSVDREALSEADRVNFDLFLRQAEESVEGNRFRDELLAVGPMQGPQSDLPQIMGLMPAFTAEDLGNVVARLETIGAVIEQTTELLREGLTTGITQPRITLEGVPAQIEAQLVDDAGSSPLLAAFANASGDIAAADVARLRADAARAIADKVVPAYRAFAAFFSEEYLPGARESIALGDLPDGEEWYAFRVRHFTTTDLTPKEIHEIGLNEVARIRGQMDAIMAETGFSGSFDEFFEFLRTDPRFFFERAEDLLAAYRDICKRADPELVKMFGTLPRTPYGVEPVPAYIEQRSTTAYYMPGSLEAGRPGTFYANTYDLKSRPKWEMEALTLHEAVPGHHLQLALAYEQGDVPAFRKFINYTAYVEGWGLYSEALGPEMGFYTDPYARFGQLTYEIWRAIRLVVDTGMHALEWTREQAIEFFRQNAGKADHDIVVEVDRYISWPGQALAYKIGELKLKELRARATERLGDRFDVRAFHDEVLGSGSLPLDVLEARIDAWIARS